MKSNHQSYKPPPTIRGQIFSEEEKQYARLNNKLLMISISVDKTCNLKCPFCYSNAGSGTLKQDKFILSDYRKILADAKALGAKTLRIAGWGEPFCDEMFYNRKDKSFPLIDLANELGLYVVFFTNGTYINKEIAKLLLSKDVSIISKKNSFNKKIQDKMSGKAGAYELISNSLSNLFEVGFNQFEPKRFAVETLITQLNYKELPELYAWLRQMNIIPYFELMMDGGRGKNSELKISNDQAKSIFHELLRIDQENFGFTWFPTPPYVGFLCDKLFYNIVISDNGDVFPCYGINICLGNVRHQTIFEILKNPIMDDLRNINKKMKGKCKNCLYNESCFGCRCDTYQKGDIFGEYSYCWH